MATTKTKDPVLYHFQNPTEVQFFLDHVGGRPFTVIFTKKNGEQRKLTGVLDTSSTKRDITVPMLTEEGWKSFNIGRVLYIGEA